MKLIAAWLGQAWHFDAIGCAVVRPAGEQRQSGVAYLRQQEYSLPRGTARFFQRFNFLRCTGQPSVTECILGACLWSAENNYAFITPREKETHTHLTGEVVENAF